MKVPSPFFIVVFFSFFWLNSFAQSDSLKVIDSTLYRVIKYDGTEYFGWIIQKDAREILLKLPNNESLYIPSHLIKEILAVKPDDFTFTGEYIGEELFSTRYFITTNGFPLNRGDHYIQWNLFGPDFQFGIAKNLGVGIMTSWGGIPIIGNFKYTIQTKRTVNFALGTLLGTGSWGLPDYGLALPFGSITLGDRSMNITASGGYGLLVLNGDKDGRGLCSIAGMIKIGKKISLVFDSFIVLSGNNTTRTYTDYVYDPITFQTTAVVRSETVKHPGMALLIPGIRWHSSPEHAFQFGFAGVYADNQFLPFPIPMVQWYRKL